MSNFPTVKLRASIVGDGPERESLENYALAKGLSEIINFPGATREPETYYRQFDVFVMSSDTEQSPISVIEAMFASLPIVATDVGDIQDMVSEPNRAFIVPLGKMDDFVARLRELVTDVEMRQTIGKANQTIAAQNYTQQVMIDQCRSLFLEIAQKSIHHNDGP